MGGDEPASVRGRPCLAPLRWSRLGDRSEVAMSNDLIRQLRLLEGDYAGQPIVVQRADLREINQLRSQLGMPLVDDKLHEVGVAATEEEAAPPPPPAPDHSEARELYRAYLKKNEAL